MGHPSIEQLLERASRGSQQENDSEQLFRLVYDELRAVAAALMRAERPDHTLQPTAVVHEAYLRLVQPEKISWESRAHFFSCLATAMRRVLIDHGRRNRADKRAGALRRVTLQGIAEAGSSELDLLLLDELLGKLHELDPRMARVVELRCLIGLKHEEIARTLGVSRRTVLGDWGVAKRWLRDQIEQSQR